MSQITYNGVTLNYVTVTQFDQEPIYDPTGIDLLYTRFYVEVECIFNPQVFPRIQAQVPPSILINQVPVITLSGANYPNSENGVRQLLEQPRKQLIFKDDQGNVLLKVPAGLPVAPVGNIPPYPSISNSSPLGGAVALAAGAAQTDEKLGPFPRKVSIKQQSGSITWIICFGIETFLTECPQAAKSPILSNRWRESMRIDRQMFQTRVHSGKLIMRGGAANFLNSVVTADVYRGWVFPPIPAGFVRESIEITLVETGLEIDYSIQDKQVYRVTDPKGVVTDIKASYTESTGNGAVINADVSVTVLGKPDTDMRDLLAIASQIVVSRMGLQGDYGPDKNDKNNPQRIIFTPKAGGKSIGIAGVISGGSITEDLMAPSLTMRLSQIKTVRDSSIQGLPKTEPPIQFGLNSTNIGLNSLPGTAVQGNSGLSPGDYGVPNSSIKGIMLLSQTLSSPCAGVGSPTIQVCVNSGSPVTVQCTTSNTQAELKPKNTKVSGDSGGKSAFSPDSNNGPPAGDGGGLTNSLTQVTVNYLTTPSTNSQNQLSADNLDFLYTDYSMDIDYYYDENKIQLPIAANVPTPSRVITVAAESSNKRIRWTAERLSQPPDVPASNTGNPNEVLLKRSITPAVQELAPDTNTYIWRISGEYTYAILTPITESQPLPTGALPNLQGTYAQNIIPSSVFQQGIISPTETILTNPGGFITQG